MLLRMHSIIMMSFRKKEIFSRRDNFESQLKHAHLPKGGIYIWLHTPGL